MYTVYTSLHIIPFVQAGYFPPRVAIAKGWRCHFLFDARLLVGLDGRNSRPTAQKHFLKIMG